MDQIDVQKFILIKRDVTDLRKLIIGENDVNEWDKMIILYTIFLMYQHVFATYTMMNKVMKYDEYNFKRDFKNLGIDERFRTGLAQGGSPNVPGPAQDSLNEIFKFFNCKTVIEFCIEWESLMSSLELNSKLEDFDVTPSDLDLIASMVNNERLKNHPVLLDSLDLKRILQISLSKDLFRQ